MARALEMSEAWGWKRYETANAGNHTVTTAETATIVILVFISALGAKVAQSRGALRFTVQPALHQLLMEALSAFQTRPRDRRRPLSGRSRLSTRTFMLADASREGAEPISTLLLGRREVVRDASSISRPTSPGSMVASTSP